MNDKPILMSPAMVRATLQEIQKPGTGKTRTRRIIEPQPRHIVDGHPWNRAGNIKCRYGQPGDLLWVREGWHTEFHYNDVRPSQLRDEAKIWFDWYACPVMITSHFCGLDLDAQWIKGRRRPSIHLPRRLSRITLEIKDIRVERLQDITEEEARAEGCLKRFECHLDQFLKASDQDLDKIQNFRTGFKHLWKEINGAKSWDENPFVWVIAFTPHLRNIDDFTGVK